MSKSPTLKIIVIGQNPAHRTGNRLSPSLVRLNRWMDRLGVRTYSMTNCSLTPGSVTSIEVDRNQLEATRGYPKVLALGAFASTALTRESIPHFALPHPSPLNRKLNSPEYETAVLNDCYRYLYHEN